MQTHGELEVKITNMTHTLLNWLADCLLGFSRAFGNHVEALKPCLGVNLFECARGLLANALYNCIHRTKKGFQLCRTPAPNKAPGRPTILPVPLDKVQGVLFRADLAPNLADDPQCFERHNLGSNQGAQPCCQTPKTNQNRSTWSRSLAKSSRLTGPAHRNWLWTALACQAALTGCLAIATAQSSRQRRMRLIRDSDFRALRAHELVKASFHGVMRNCRLKK